MALPGSIPRLPRMSHAPLRFPGSEGGEECRWADGQMQRGPLGDCAPLALDTDAARSSYNAVVSTATANKPIRSSLDDSSVCTPAASMSSAYTFHR
jgi:hypothetical protein